MAKILLNTTKENQINIDFGFLDNYIEEKDDNHIILNCLFNNYETNIIDYSKLKENFSLLLEAYAAFDSETYTFSFSNKLNNFEIISLLLAIDIDLNDNYTFIFNVSNKEATKELISLYKKLTTNKKLEEGFLKKQNNGDLKESSHVFSKLIFNYKPDYTGKKLLILDTHNKYHRDYNAMPNTTNSQNKETLVIKNFLRMMSNIENNKPDYIILATEGKNGIRYKMSPDYKKDRKETDEALIWQINEIEKLAEKLGVKVIGVDKYEADDVIGSYALSFASFGGNVQIVTTDKDINQILSDKISIYNPVTKKIVNTDFCIEKFGVTPKEMRLYLALMGDSSDCVSGVKGVGGKTAVSYIKNFGNSVEDVLNGSETLKDGSAAKRNLENGKEDLIDSYALVQLFTYLTQELYTFEDFKFPDKLNWSNIEEDMQELEIFL